jgi:hypothetical protein
MQRLAAIKVQLMMFNLKGGRASQLADSCCP